MRKLIFVLFLIGFLGCEKKSTDNLIDGSFKVGRISVNSTVQRFDPEIVTEASIPDNNLYSTEMQYDTLDVDNDGTDDFIVLADNTRPVPGLIKSIRIIIYNSNFEVVYDDNNFTEKQYIFTQNDTLYEVNCGINVEFTPPTEATIDTLYGTGFPEQPKAFNIEDTISHSERWSNDYLGFFYKDSTVYFNEQLDRVLINNYAFGDWNNNGPKYLIFRLNKMELKYYGWLKLEIEDFSRIRISEIYFQNNGFNE